MLAHTFAVPLLAAISGGSTWNVHLRAPVLASSAKSMPGGAHYCKMWSQPIQLAGDHLRRGRAGGSTVFQKCFSEKIGPEGPQRRPQHRADGIGCDEPDPRHCH